MTGSLGFDDDLLYEQRQALSGRPRRLKRILFGQNALDAFAKGVSALLIEGRKLHGKTTFQDLPISIENKKGSVRKGTDDDGEEWKTKMRVPYGYIPGTEGADGDEVDVFTGPNKDAAYAYVVHTNCPESGEFDEDKVMLGFDSAKSAKKVFLQHYDDPNFFGGIDTIPMWKFRNRIWIKKHTTKRLMASGFREAGFSSKSLIHNQKPNSGGQARIFTARRRVRTGGPGSGPQTHEGVEERISELKSLMKSSNSIERNAATRIYHALYKDKDKNPIREGHAKFKTKESRRTREGRVYYARSLQHYGSTKESADLDLLEDAFPGDDIKFPSTRRHSELGMDHFHKQIDKAREVVIRPIRRRRVTAGVFSEAQHALHAGKKVHMLIEGKLRRVKRLEMIENGNPAGEYARVILRKRR